MTTHRAGCRVCGWSFDADDVERAKDEAALHVAAVHPDVYERVTGRSAAARLAEGGR